MITKFIKSFTTQNFVLILMACFMFSSCSAMFVRVTKDPYKKLLQAQDLLVLNRPLPAERLSLESLSEFQENNDEWGVGQAYGVLGLIYKSPAVENWKNYYLKNGFLRNSVKYENRLSKAVECLTKAEEIFLKFQRFEPLTRVRLQLADVYSSLSQSDDACLAYRRALSSHKDFVSNNPEVNLSIPAGYSSFEEFIGSTLKKANCK